MRYYRHRRNYFQKSQLYHSYTYSYCISNTAEEVNNSSLVVGWCCFEVENNCFLCNEVVSLKPVANLTYIITPYNVGFIGEDLVGELENNGVFIWWIIRRERFLPLSLRICSVGAKGTDAAYFHAFSMKGNVLRLNCGAGKMQEGWIMAFSEDFPMPTEKFSLSITIIPLTIFQRNCQLSAFPLPIVSRTSPTTEVFLVRLCPWD